MVRPPHADLEIPIRRVAVVAATLGAFVLSIAGVARAADIPRLVGPITDQTGVLAGGSDEIEDAIGDLLAGHNVQLFVLFVETTEELTVTEFADETARVNSLGVNDALLLVALDDRTDAIWIADGLAGEDGITDAELDDIIGRTLEPQLADGDFVGAVVAAAEALGIAASTSTPTPRPEPTDRPDAGGGGSTDASGLIGVVLVGIGIAVLVVWLAGRVSRAIASRRDAEERDRRTGRLAREANSLLISTDERTRTADDEAGFVEAEFGDEHAAPFRAAISKAREELTAAFAIRQRLDDAEPEDPPARERMLTEIVQRCRMANAALDEQVARLEELRHLERHAPEVLAALPAQADAQEARLRAAEAALEALRRYAPEAWKPVDGNVPEARKGLEGARSAIARASAVPAPAARSLVREILVAQEGIAGARALIDGVEAQAHSVRDAEEAQDREVRAAAADLDAARTMLGEPAGGGGPDDRTLDLESAERALAAARAAAEARPGDPIGALRFAARARLDAAAVLAAARGVAAERTRLRATLEAAVRTAAIDVQRATDFIGTRHNGVGRRARTRLAEAQRILDRAYALQDSDPTSALADAQRAERLAEEAYALAGRDFDRWDAGGPSPTGGGGDLAGAILGGILGGILSGGGRGGGWGGSSWGSQGRDRGGGGGGFGGGGGGRGGGGWGGGGHSAGGGFGGGGGGGGSGRSRGGRW